MKTRFLKFMAAADDGSGGAAVLDPPDTDAAMTPVGEIFEQEMRKSRGEEAKEPAAKPAAQKEEPPAKPDKASAAPAKEEAKAKPASALDAALDTAPPADEKKGDVVLEDPLKDFPEEPVEGQKRNWKGLREVADKGWKEVATTRAEVARLTKELETAKTSPPETAQELAALKEKLDSYKDAIVAINIEMDPEFRAKFVEGRNALVTKAASKLSAYGGNGDALKTALDMPEGRSRTAAIKEALGELEDVEKTRVLQFVGEVERLDDERADIQKDPQQAWEKLTRTQAKARQKQVERAEVYKKEVFESVSKALPSKLTLLKTVDSSIEGAAEWNQGVEQIKKDAFKLLGNDATPEQLAEAALWATAGPKIQEHWLADRAELAKARAALKEYEESEPGFRGGKPPKKDAKAEKIEADPGKLYADAMSANPND